MTDARATVPTTVPPRKSRKEVWIALGAGALALLAGVVIGYLLHPTATDVAAGTVDTASCRLALSTADNLADMQRSFQDTLEELRNGEVPAGQTLEDVKHYAEAQLGPITE